MMGGSLGGVQGCMLPPAGRVVYGASLLKTALRGEAEVVSTR